MRCWQDKHRKNNNKSAKVTTTDQRSHSDRSLRFLSSLHCAVFSHLHILISIFYIYVLYMYIESIFSVLFFCGDKLGNESQFLFNLFELAMGRSPSGCLGHISHSIGKFYALSSAEFFLVAIFQSPWCPTLL